MTDVQQKTLAAAEETRADTPAPVDTATRTPTMLDAFDCNQAQLISDVSIPDGWQIGPSEYFTKIWRLKNAGACAWNSGYFIIFDRGDRMNAPDARQLTTGTVASGETIDVSLDLLSPASTGAYQADFKLLAADGSIFGIGPGADESFQVKIEVVLGEPDLITYQVESEVVVAPGNPGDVTAECPIGTIATGGGFDGGQTMAAFYQGRNGNGWRVSAMNESGADQILAAYAICLTKTAAVTVSQTTNDASIYPGVLGQSNIPCPSGVVSSIGYEYDPKVLMIAGGDTMGNTVRVFAVNTSLSMQTLRGMAICLTPSTRATSYLASTDAYVPGGASKPLEATCPPSTFVSGGSFDGARGLMVTHSSLKPGANTWVVTAQNPTRENLVFISHAVCMKITMM